MCSKKGCKSAGKSNVKSVREWLGGGTPREGGSAKLSKDGM